MSQEFTSWIWTIISVQHGGKSAASWLATGLDDGCGLPVFWFPCSQPLETIAATAVSVALGFIGKHERQRVRVNLRCGNREHRPTAKRSRFSAKQQIYLETRVALTPCSARNKRIFGKESFTASNNLANCSQPKRGTSHWVFFLS